MVLKHEAVRVSLRVGAAHILIRFFDLFERQLALTFRKLKSTAALRLSDHVVVPKGLWVEWQWMCELEGVVWMGVLHLKSC